jgi:hypothetical protein
LWQSGAVISALYLGLLVLGVGRFSEGMLRGCFAAQQLALASTLILWMVVQQFPLVLNARQMPLDHFRVGIFFLFVGPLALIAVAFFAGLVGWKSYFTALVGACAGQWAIGFFELGGALQLYPLVIAGFISLGIFLFLIVFAIAHRRHPAIRNAY